MDFHAKQIRAPRYWQEFEELCLCLFKAIWNDPLAEKNGRVGQPQHGVDIYGSTDEQRTRYRGVQCKGKDENYGARVTASELNAEIKKAKNFKPPLQHWILATSAPNDAALQAKARKISQRHAKQGLFSVQVLGWDDLQGLIADHPAALERFYPELAFDARAILESLHESTIQPGSAFRQDLVDGVILERLSTLRRCRFFFGANSQERSRQLAATIRKGELAGGSSRVKARALAWCSRLLASGADVPLAREILEAPRSLEITDESTLAEAFIIASAGDFVTG